MDTIQIKKKFKLIVPPDCTNCGLSKNRTQVVPYGGRILATCVILGEGPGSEEDLKGRPFVGRSGKKLFKVIRLLGYRRRDFLILNCVKCRPPENRNPTFSEMASCFKYLSEQLYLSRATTMLILGKVAWKGITGEDLPVLANRGLVKQYGKWKLIYTYHPSYVLRNNTIEVNKNFLLDIKKAIKISGIKNEQI